jgi:hypothetical protein
MMMPSTVSRISVLPGTIMFESWLVSSVARAMMSPTRCRSWNVLLLPSRLA